MSIEDYQTTERAFVPKNKEIRKKKSEIEIKKEVIDEIENRRKSSFLIKRSEEGDDDID